MSDEPQEESASMKLARDEFVSELQKLLFMIRGGKIKTAAIVALGQRNQYTSLQLVPTGEAFALIGALQTTQADIREEFLTSECTCDNEEEHHHDDE